MAKGKEEPTTVVEEGSQDTFDKIGDQLREITEADNIDFDKLEELSASLDGLSDGAKKAFYDLPQVQNMLERMGEAEGEEGENQPGSYRQVGSFNVKVPWKMTDLEDFPKKSYMPSKREQYTWNGIKFIFEQDVEYEVPEPVYKLIMTLRAGAAKARNAEKTGIGNMGVKFLGTGWPGKEIMDAIADGRQPEGE